MPRWKIEGSYAHRRALKAEASLRDHGALLIRRKEYWRRGNHTSANKHTYAIASADATMVKIGRANDIAARLADLQSCSPVALVLIASVEHDIEMRMHHALADYRSHGEWFELNDQTLPLILRVMRASESVDAQRVFDTCSNRYEGGLKIPRAER